LARFLALSQPRLCPMGLTFARFSTASKICDRNDTTRPVNPGKAQVERDGKIWRIL
jgi:hypothetical protein